MMDIFTLTIVVLGLITIVAIEQKSIIFLICFVLFIIKIYWTLIQPLIKNKKNKNK